MGKATGRTFGILSGQDFVKPWSCAVLETLHLGMVRSLPLEMLRVWVGWEIELGTRSSPKSFPTMIKEKQPHKICSSLEHVWERDHEHLYSNDYKCQKNIRWAETVFDDHFFPAHLEIMSSDNFTLTCPITCLLTPWPTLSYWAVTDQMDSSAVIMGRIALIWNEGDNFIHSQMGVESLL